jgi:hypothetical protein
MAQRIVLICDVHKAEDDTEHDAIRTRTFALDGEAVAVDVCADWDNQLTTMFALMQRCGRPAVLPGPKRAPGTRTGPGRSDRARQIRAWCNKKGIEVNQRGRIPASITEAYDFELRNTRTT